MKGIKIIRASHCSQIYKLHISQLSNTLNYISSISSLNNTPFYVDIYLAVYQHFVQYITAIILSTLHTSHCLTCTIFHGKFIQTKLLSKHRIIHPLHIQLPNQPHSRRILSGPNSLGWCSLDDLLHHIRRIFPYRHDRHFAPGHINHCFNHLIWRICIAKLAFIS